MANTKKKKETLKSGEKKKLEDVQNGIKKDAKLVGKDENLAEDREEASIGVDDTSVSKLSRTKQKVPNKVSSKSTSGLPTSMYTPFTVAAVAVVSYFAYQGYWETRINTPFSDQKVVVSTGLEEPDRYWGTYRPGVYFGVRTREPKSLLGGLMWFIPRLWAVGDVNLRHNCEQGDNLDSYGWLEHDGRNFGYQDIQDKFVRMSTAFVKRQGGLNGGDWTAKIQVEPRVPEAKDELVSVMFYFTLDEGAEGRLVPVLDGSGTAVTSIIGSTPSLGEFQVHFQNGPNVTLNSYLSTNIPSPHVVKDMIMRGMRVAKHDGQQHILLGGDMLFGENQDKLPNLVVFNAMGKLPFDIEIVYESTSNYERINRLAGNVFDKALQNHQREFRQKFEDTFKLAKKSFPEKDIIFAKAAMSNMIGGIGYFYGMSRVQSAITKEPVPYWPAPLYTAVPSRSFFPRGFLWDEGFHNLLIAKWDKEISQDIIAHWLDLMNVEGWIPREQILGIEARVRVPDEFVVQKNSNANPPTLLLTLYELFGEAETISQADVEYLQRAWPRLVTWYNWFNTTQIGKEPGSYYWRGRDASTLRELNPKSFSSGLDDFPRASHPTEDERHLDLRCWMALASKLMSHIAELIGRDGSKFTETWKSLSDNKMLDRVHWSTKAQMFADYGLHSSKVKLKRPKTNPNMPRPEMIREVVTPPTLGYVDDTFGYVNLFPLFTEVLDPASPKLEKLMEDLRNPKHLWTKYGLRSLSKSSPLYDKRNTEHDPPYWRGPVWINMNYLAVKSLFHYANVEGPYQTRAKTLYNELRENVITNVISEYYRTGYIWEQYSDKSGEGQGCKPFTGWSSLVVLMMAESY